MCGTSALSAQEMDPDHPSDISSSSVSESWTDLQPSSYIPLDLKQKYIYSINEMAGPTHWIAFAMGAAMDQALKSPVGWGNGGGSFGVRMANHFGLAFLHENIAFGIRALDHEDPRYFRKGTGSTSQRVKYALRSTFLARRDSGGWLPAYSVFAADFATPFLAQTWRPDGFSMARAFRGGPLHIGAGFGANLWQEFWPDIRKIASKHSKLLRERGQSTTPAVAIP
jgi:hypothetical protein